VRQVCHGWRIVDLETGADFDVVSSDPDGFLRRNPEHVVFDEALRLPALFTALRPALDAGADDARGRYVLTGSASPELMRGVSESLAGRIGIVELTPLRTTEVAATPWAGPRRFRGGFPPALAMPDDRAWADWCDAYLSAVLGRDLRDLGFDLPPQRLRTLLGMLVHLHGNLLNASELSRALGVDAGTVTRHLDVLEGAFLIRRLRPHFANLSKRLVKTPKVYVRDPGLLHFLGGLRAESDLETWHKRGASFEGLVVEELLAQAGDRVARPYAAFWRTSAGVEVDLLVGTEANLFPVEIKSGSKIDARDLRGMKTAMNDLGLKRGWVVLGDGERQDLGNGVEAVPWPLIARGEVRLPV
jgi:predicted AAA+ superfamily ATPase